MEPFYDSDEGIAWGPLTLREIRREFEKKPKKVHPRRQTAIGTLKYSSDIESQSSASTVASEYFTPNESMQPEPSVNRNKVFLEQLSKVVSDDLDSSYATAADTTSTSRFEEDTMLRILKSQSPCDLEKIQQSLVENTPQKAKPSVVEISDDEQSYSDLDDVIVISDSSSDDVFEPENVPVHNFIKSEKKSELHNFNNPSPQDKELEGESSGTEDLMHELNLVKEKLAEYQKSDSSSFSPEKEDWELVKKRGSEINNSITTEESLCEDVELPSSDIEDLQIAGSDSEDNMQIASSELPCVEDLQIAGSDSEDNMQIAVSELPCVEDFQVASSESDAQEEMYHHIEEAVAPKQKNQLEGEQYLEQEHGIDDYQNFTEEIQEKNNLLGLEANQLHLSRVTSPRSSSPKGSFSLKTSANSLENPASSLASTASEDSFSKSDSLTFNDTMEEIEMALRHGLNYVMPGEQNVPKITLEVPSNLNSQQTESTKSDKKKQFRTPTSKKYDYVQSKIGDYIRKSPPANSDTFKLPMRPPKHKLTPVQTKSFKNITSPVGVYIKNSPGILKTNVTPKVVRNLNISPITEVSKSDNISELPPVIYKPAKKVIVSQEKEVNLPANIKKIIPEIVITKHQKKITQRDLNETSINRRLIDEEADLTSTTVDSGFLNETDADMSFVASKQALIK